MLLFIPATNIKALKIHSIFFSSSILFLNFLLIFFFNLNTFEFQNLIELHFFNSNLLNVHFVFGIDGLSIFFLFLSTLLIFLSILFIWNEEKYFKNYLFLLFLLELLLVITFSVLDVFLFYIFFEAILIPMFLIIGFWGSREKKIRAGYLLFFYTITSSVLMLVGIFYIYSIAGTFCFEQLQNIKFSFLEQKVLWIFFFLSFATKVPMFPFHIWLPEAHVEAPTVGSVILAGVLLKLGVYGFLRFSLILFPKAFIFFSPLVYCICLIGILFSSFTAIKQTDLKKIIAYSSVAHMNLVILGIFSGNVIGIEAAILQSISHGFISSALFFLIGALYNRYHSRIVHYYSGLVIVMPIYSTFFLFFTMSNIALPGTSNFVGEFLLINGIFQDSFITAILSGLSVILSGAYSLWLYNRICYGNLKTTYIVNFRDLDLKEFFILFVLLLLSLLLGVYPKFFLNFLHCSVIKMFLVINFNSFF